MHPDGCTRQTNHANNWHKLFEQYDDSNSLPPSETFVVAVTVGPERFEPLYVLVLNKQRLPDDDQITRSV